jgi:hypothetical protein
MSQSALKARVNNCSDLLVLWGGSLFSLALTALIYWAGARLQTTGLLQAR